MHELRFFTPDPLDHCARLFDVVRRMGFNLVSLCATPGHPDSFAVVMNFVPLGDLSPGVLANRVAGFVGVASVQLESRQNNQ